MGIASMRGPRADPRTATAFEGPAALRRTLDVPKARKDHEMPEEGIVTAVEPILRAIPAGNPAPVTAHTIEALPHAAWEGNDPS